LSQVNKHQEAFEIGRNATRLTEELIKCSYQLCHKLAIKLRGSSRSQQLTDSAAKGDSINDSIKMKDHKKKGGSRNEMYSPYTAGNNGSRRSGAQPL
jgi:hypothetical protein